MAGQKFAKGVGIAVLALAMSICASAQYGGPGGGTGGGTTGGVYNPSGKSYGHGALIGGVAAGAGAGALLLFMHHRHAAVVGCVAPDGKTLTADNGKHTYQLTGAALTAGEHVSVAGKKSKGPSGLDELDVASVKKDLGQCEAQQAGLLDQKQ